MNDKELAARWDADHRLAATASFVSGLVVVAGTALMFTIGTVPVEAIIQGQAASPFEITLVTGLLLVIDIALLLFVVGLAHAFAEGQSFGLSAATAVVTLATTASATLHLTWGYVASSPEMALPNELVQFVTWLSVNLWLLPLFGLLVGATLLALTLALRTSSFRFAQRLGTASARCGRHPVPARALHRIRPGPAGPGRGRDDPRGDGRDQRPPDRRARQTRAASPKACRLTTVESGHGRSR